MSYQPPPPTYVPPTPPPPPTAPAEPRRTLAKKLLILVPVVAVSAAVGALSTYFALGPVKTVKVASAPAKPPVPAAFSALPNICSLLPDSAVQRLAPQSKPDPGAIHVVTNSQNFPESGCKWASPDLNTTRGRTLSVEVVLYPTTAQASGPDLAKAAFDKKHGEDQANAGKTVPKDLGGTQTYSQVSDISDLGQQAYSFYDVMKFPPTNDPTGTAYVWIRRGNVVIEADYTGYDMLQNGPQELPEATARANAEDGARTVMLTLNNCTGCAAH